MRKKLLATFSFTMLFTWGITVFAQAHTKSKTPTNLALQYGRIHSDSGAEKGQLSTNLIDGITRTTNLSKKWCKVKQQTHWVIIDLGEVREIASFAIYDSKVNEPSESNFHTYNIYVGNDVKNLTKVVSQSGRGRDNIKEDILTSNVEGRYVKLEIPDFRTIRIWEFEIYDSAPNITMNTIPNQRIMAGVPISVIAPFTLLSPRASDFAYNVQSKTGFTAVSNIVEDEDASIITFDLTAPNVFGFDTVSVEVRNNGESLSKSFNVKSISDDLSPYVNVALKKRSTVWNFSPWINSQASAIVDGNDNSFFSIRKSLIEPIVDLRDKYIITSLQYIYKCVWMADNTRISGVLVYTSPDIAAGTADAAYRLQDDHFPEANVGELESEFVVLDKPTEVGSLKFKFLSDSWTTKELRLYELKAFCEKPVITQPEDLMLVGDVPKDVLIDFDMKGFALVDKANIRFSASSDNADILIDLVQGDFDTNKLGMTLTSHNESTSGTVTVKIESNDFMVSNTFNVIVTGPVSLEENAKNATLEVYPNIVSRGECINVKAGAAGVVRLISLVGTVVSEQRMVDGAVQLSTDALQAGTYLVQVLNDGAMFEAVRVVVR